MTDNGENPKDRLGEAKPPLWLVPSALLIVVSKVMQLGARKYGAYNWRIKKVRATVYLTAAMRHLLSALDGEEIDPESGQPHVAHAAACMGILIDAQATGNLVDDRPTPGAAAKLIAQLTEKSAPKEWRCKHCGEHLRRVMWSGKLNWAHPSGFWSCKGDATEPFAELAE